MVKNDIGTQNVNKDEDGASKSATQQIFEQLEHDILSGEIESGTLLSEGEIAKRFNVSRTPVRKALSLLASSGLVTTLPKRGHLVRTVSLAEVRDAYFLREILEVEAVSLAMRHTSKEDIEKLLEYVDQFNDLTSIKNPLSANRMFHMKIAHASGNKILAEFIEQLLKRMERVMALDPNFKGISFDGEVEEKAILEAMVQGNEKEAREAMRAHIRRSLNAITQYQ